MASRPGFGIDDTPIGVGPGGAGGRRAFGGAALAAGLVALAAMAWDLQGAWTDVFPDAYAPARLAAPLVAVAAYLALGASRRSLGLALGLEPSARWWLKTLLFTAGIFVVVLAVASLVLWLAGISVLEFPPDYRGELEAAVLLDSIVGAPLVEEPIWRLAALPGLVALVGPRWALVIDGLGFGVLHFAYGNPAPDNFFGGYVFAYAYLKSGTLWLPLGLHAFGNAFANLGNSVAWHMLHGA